MPCHRLFIIIIIIGVIDNRSVKVESVGHPVLDYLSGTMVCLEAPSPGGAACLLEKVLCETRTLDLAIEMMLTNELPFAAKALQCDCSVTSTLVGGSEPAMHVQHSYVGPTHWCSWFNKCVAANVVSQWCPTPSVNFGVSVSHP